MDICPGPSVSHERLSTGGVALGSYQGRSSYGSLLRFGALFEVPKVAVG